jgi:hypothetical protein
MVKLYTDPATGRTFGVDEATGATSWLDPTAVGQPQDPNVAVPPPPLRPSAPRKKRPIFLWFFVAVQVLFVVWIISGVADASGQPNNCEGLTPELCNDAESVGTGLGVGLVVLLWVVVDFLLAVVYGVYRLAKRA